MTTLRTVIFIDGQNFKYNLRDFRFSSPIVHATGTTPAKTYPPYRLDEKHFKWQEFFSGVIKKFDDRTHWQHQLLRVYWCHAATIRSFDSKSYGSSQAIKKILQQYQATFPSITEDLVRKLAEDWYRRERENFQVTKDKVFEDIQRSVPFVEFNYVGEFVVKPLEVHRFEMPVAGTFLYEGTHEGEKGVDVGIAVDMVAKLRDYDVAILVSGDADFLPAVRHIKDNLRLVYQFSLAKGIPPTIRYLSPWLVGCVDLFESYTELELLKFYLNRKAGIPNAIVQVIDQRIAGLEAMAAVP